ncbi:MAG: carbohydrate ABC transporter permease, partial [Phycisphaeraceae bacterium]
MASLASKRRNLVVAIGFLLPNILGVLTFVVFPVIFSIFMAFSNWDLKKHNLEVFEPLEFVGLGNFIRLLTEADFLRYFGNTLFLMIAIPFSVAGSLLAAILLSKDTRGGGGRVGVWLLAGTGLVVSVAMLTVLGLGATGMTILLVGVACGVLILGMVGGRTAYRTFFYTPHFVAGVATFLLWKKLYNPTSGPINAALRPVLNAVESTVNALGPGVTMVRWVLLGLVGLLVALALHRVRRWWTEGDLGSGAIVVPVG